MNTDICLETAVSSIERNTDSGGLNSIVTELIKKEFLFSALL